jgi:hypothetical protein
VTFFEDLLQTIDLILNDDRRQKEGMKNQGVGKGVTTMNLDVLDAKEMKKLKKNGRL